MLNDIASFFLYFAQQQIIVPIVVFGYIWLDKSTFYHAICLILINILFNSALKDTFQVPLLPHLASDGFSFPSGHMQATCALYGWLFTKTSNTHYKIALILLLLGIGNSLVYKGYHTYIDVLFGALFAMMLVPWYNFLLRKGDDWTMLSLISFSTFLVIYIEIVYHGSDITWKSYHSMFGLIIGEKFLTPYHPERNIKNQSLSTFLSLTGLFIVKAIFGIKVVSSLPVSLNQVQWALVGFIVPLSPIIAAKVGDWRIFPKFHPELLKK